MKGNGVLLSALVSSAELSRAKKLWYRAYQAGVLVIVALLVLAMTLGSQVPKAAADDDFEIPGVAEITEPTIGVPPEQPTIPDFPDAPDQGTTPDAGGANGGQIPVVPPQGAPIPQGAPAQPLGGLEYQQNPAKWCRENFDLANPEAVGDLCPNITGSEGSVPLTALMPSLERPQADEESILDDIVPGSFESSWESADEWKMGLKFENAHLVSRLGVEFDDPNTPAGHDYPHNATVGYEYSGEVYVDGNKSDVDATVMAVSKERVEVELKEPLELLPEQSLEIKSGFSGETGKSEMFNVYKLNETTAGPEFRSLKVGFQDPEARLFAAYAQRAQVQPAAATGTCDPVRVANAKPTWWRNYNSRYGRQSVTFTARESGTISKVRLHVNRAHTLSTSGRYPIEASLKNGAGVTKQYFGNGQISWNRVGNDVEFALGVDMKVSPGDTFTLQMYNVPESFGYYSPGYGVSACGFMEVTDATKVGNFEQPIPNPSEQLKCGQKIALIFDLSNSIGVDGLRRTKEAGRRIVERLTGTPTEVGLYNFATTAPAGGNSSNTTDALDMRSTRNVWTLNRLIDGLTIASSSVAGTNWQAALLQTAGKGYDVVYLVTDGEPTADNDWRADNEPGQIAHKRDIDNAILAANQLKREGTRVEGIGVGLNQDDVHVLKNQAKLGRPSSLASDSLYWSRRNNPRFENQPGTLASNNYRFYRQAVHESVPRRELLAYISGPKEGDDWFDASDYNDLVDKLEKKILKHCESKLIVYKEIVKQDGSIVKGENWEFTAKARANGGLVDASDPTQNTGTEGHAIWDYNMRYPDAPIDPNNPPASIVEVEEVQQNGYDIELQGGKRAVCSRWGKELPVNNLPNSETGFDVKVDIHGPVVCTVRNKELAPTGFLLKKVGYKDGQLVDQSLSNAKFAIHSVEADGSIGAPLEQKVNFEGTLDSYAVKDLPIGEYFLVETKSPAGYSLLPRPIRFKINYKRDDSGRYVVVNGKYLTEVTIIDDTNTVPAAVEYVKVDNSGREAVITLANYEVGALPLTGGNGLTGYVLGAITLVGAALAIRRKLA